MLFESEPDNAYAEEAVLLQLEALHRGARAGALTTAAGAEAMLAHAADAVARAAAGAEARHTGQQHWVTHDPRYFMLLYRALLAATQHGVPLPAPVRATLADVPLHPLLAQMLQRFFSAPPQVSVLSSVNAATFLLTGH